MNEKVRKQIHDSIGQIHEAGMKFLPKMLGKKLRHRNMSKSKLKKMNVKVSLSQLFRMNLWLAGKTWQRRQTARRSQEEKEQEDCH